MTEAFFWAGLVVLVGVETRRGLGSALCGCQALCWVTAWEVLKFHSVTALDTITASSRAQSELGSSVLWSWVSLTSSGFRLVKLKRKRGAAQTSLLYSSTGSVI